MDDEDGGMDWKLLSARDRELRLDSRLFWVVCAVALFWNEERNGYVIWLFIVHALNGEVV